MCTCRGGAGDSANRYRLNGFRILLRDLIPGTGRHAALQLQRRLLNLLGIDSERADGGAELKFGELRVPQCRPIYKFLCLNELVPPDVAAQVHPDDEKRQVLLGVHVRPIDPDMLDRGRWCARKRRLRPFVPWAAGLFAPLRWQLSAPAVLA